MTESKKNCAEEMFPLMESYLGSRVTQNEFGAEHGMSVSILNYWLAKYRPERTESGGVRGIFSATGAAHRPLL